MIVGLTIVVDLLPFLESYWHERKASSIRSQDQFGLSSSILTPLGALMMLAAVGFGTAIAVAASESSLSLDVPSLPAFSLSELIMFMLITPMAFMIGLWMGSRLKAPTTLLEGAVNVLGAYVIGMVVPLALILAYVHVTDQLQPSQWIASALLLVAFLIAVLYGLHTGQRRILGMYMGYLLARVPEEVRQAAISRVYQDVIDHHRSPVDHALNSQA